MVTIADPAPALGGSRLEDAASNAFSPAAARAAIRRTMKAALQQHAGYDAAACAQLATSLADEVRLAVVAATPCARYKLVVQVQVSEKRGQAVAQGLRYLWDGGGSDTCVAETVETDGVACACQVLALYLE